jgi:hypothetical protein
MKVNDIYKIKHSNKIFITESVPIHGPRIPSKNKKYITESLGVDWKNSKTEIPDAIFPLINCISADVVTRNFTFYPTESLVGNPEEGTGYFSWKYPYPTPWIQGHNTSGGLFGGTSSEIYGRTVEAFWHNNAESTKGGVSAIPAIVDPYAIERILDGRWSTVSIGSITTSVKCSICGFNFADGDHWAAEGEKGCPHEKGRKYVDEGGDGVEKTCHWVIGPIQNRETSFVIVPSDASARVVNPNVDPNSFKIFAGNPNQEYIFDAEDPKRANLMESDNPSVSSLASSLCLGSRDIYNDFKNERTIFIFESMEDESMPKVEEKKLTSKARKSLPSGAFALVYKDKKSGKTLRRFPIHDAAHARNALARLPQAKGLTPAQRATVKRKAQAALKRDTGGKYKPPKEFTKEQWEEEVSKLLEDYEAGSEGEDGPEEIEVTEENYPILFDLVDELEEDLDSALVENEKLEEIIEELKEELETLKKEPPKEDKKEDVEKPKEEISEEKPKEEEKEKPEEKEGDISLDQIEALKSILKDKTEDEAKMKDKFKEVLAKSIAYMKISSNKFDVKGKTLEEVVEKLKTRSFEYLVGVLEDLQEESAEPNVDPEKVEKAEDPIEKGEEPKVEEKNQTDYESLVKEAKKEALEELKELKERFKK